MALKINTNIKNDVDSYLIDASSVRGGYIVVSGEDSDTKESLSGAVLVDGSLVYDAKQQKTYRYKSNQWVEEKILADAPEVVITAPHDLNPGGVFASITKDEYDILANNFNSRLRVIYTDSTNNKEITYLLYRAASQTVNDAVKYLQFVGSDFTGARLETRFRFFEAKIEPTGSSNLYTCTIFEHYNNYNYLNNRPVINSKTVEGNRTADYYGLQDKLVSGTNIKTVSGQSILGSGDISVSSASITVYVDDEQSIYSGGVYQITDGQFKILKDNKDAKIIAVVNDLGQLEKISDVTLIFEQQTRSINAINDTDIITFMHKACNDDFSPYDFSATAYTEYNDDGFWYCYVKFSGIAINYNHLSYRPQLNGTLLSGNVITKTINGQSIMGTGNIDISGTGDLFVDPYRDDATENNQNLARTRTVPFAPLSNGVIDGEFEINLNKDFRTGGSNWEYLEEYNCYYPMMNNIEYYPSGAQWSDARAYYFLDKSWWALYPHRIYFNKDEHTLNSLAFWMSASYSIDSRTGQVAADVPAVTVKVKAYKNGAPESAGNVICSDLVLPAIPAGTHIDSVDEYSRYVHLIDLEQFDSIGFEFATDGKKRVNIAFCQGSISEDTTLYKWDALATKDELNKTADQFIDELNSVRADVELNAEDIAINAAKFDEFQTEVNSKLGNVRVQNVKNLPDPKEEVVNVIFKHNNDLFVCEKSGELIDRTFDLHELTGTNSISTAGQIEAVEREAFKNCLKIDSIVKGARNNGEIKLGNSSTAGAITFKIGTFAEIADMPLSRISFDIRSFYEDRPSHFDIVTYNEDQGESFVQGSYDINGTEHFDVDLNEFIFTYEDTISIIGDRAPEYDGRFYLDNVNVIFGEAEYSYAELAKVGEGEFKTINGIEITGEGDIDTNPKTVIYLTAPITSITTAGRTWTLSAALLDSFISNPNLGVLLAYKVNGTQISYNFTKYADTRTTSSNSFYLTFVYDHITTLTDGSMTIDSYVLTIRSTGEAKLYKAANPIDYDALLNRPSINGTVLTGDCSVKTVNGESIIGEGNIEITEEVYFNISTPITTTAQTISLDTQLYQKILEKILDNSSIRIIVDEKYQGDLTTRYAFTMEEVTINNNDITSISYVCTKTAPNQAPATFRVYEAKLTIATVSTLTLVERKIKYGGLDNLPQINSHVLTGNLAGGALGLQDQLISGTNIKTINNESILGSGNINIGLGGDTYTKEDFTNIVSPSDPTPIVQGLYSSFGKFGSTMKSGCHTTIDETGVEVNEMIRMTGCSQHWLETNYPNWAELSEEEKAEITDRYNNGTIMSDYKMVLAGSDTRPYYIQGNIAEDSRKELALLEDTHIGDVTITLNQVVAISPLLKIAVTEQQQAVLENANIALVNIDARDLGDPSLSTAMFTKTPSSIASDIMLVYTSVSYFTDGQIADTRQYFIRYDTITKTATLDTQIINRLSLPTLPFFDINRQYVLKLIPNVDQNKWEMLWVVSNS